MTQDEHDDPIRRARRQAPPTEPVVNWNRYKQRGPSCDLDERGDPVPPKVTER